LRRAISEINAEIIKNQHRSRSPPRKESPEKINKTTLVEGDTPKMQIQPTKIKNSVVYKNEQKPNPAKFKATNIPASKKYVNTQKNRNTNFILRSKAEKIIENLYSQLVSIDGKK